MNRKKRAASYIALFQLVPGALCVSAVGPLSAVLLLQKCAHVVVQPGVVAVDGGAQGSFGGAALGNTLQDSNQVLHAVGVANVFGGGQGFVVGQARLGRAEADKAAV